MSADVLLEIDQMYAGYPGHRVIRGLSMQVQAGDIVCLLGPSGCGKTTVLRAIGGFTPILDGEIRLRERVVSRAAYTLSPEKRRIGMVFQDNALFPHLNIAANIAFGLRGRSRQEQRNIVGGLLEVVDLMGLEARYPHELSGGQQQRVALARALAPDPDLLLLDEPFSNLDVDLRSRLSAQVRGILRERSTTAILVTHDQNEAFALSEHIGVMHAGRILQWDSAYNLYHRPVERFVADFIGQGVFLRGKLLDTQQIETEVGIIRGRGHFDWPTGSAVDVLLRPDDVQQDADAAVQATVSNRAFIGPKILYSLALASGATLLSLSPSSRELALGDKVGIRVSAEHLVAFPADPSASP